MMKSVQMVEEFLRQRPGHSHVFSRSDLDAGLWIETVVVQLQLLAELFARPGVSSRPQLMECAREMLLELIEDRPTQEKFRAFAASVLLEAAEEMKEPKITPSV